MKQRFFLALFALLLFTTTAFAQNNEHATVWFYRVEEVPRLMRDKAKLRINGTVTATFPEREYIGVRLKSGRYVFTLGQPQSATALVVEAGRNYYVQVSHTIGGHGFNGLIEQIFIRDEAQGLLHLEQMKRTLKDSNIKDKSLEIIREKPSAQD